jgi:cytochrome c556
MALMQYHMGQARKTARSTTCSAVDAQRHLQRMRALAEDSTPIFAAVGYVDASYERRRDGFINEVDKGLVAGADCAAIGSALKQIADACEACHHETR